MYEDGVLEELRIKTYEDLVRICGEYVQIYDRLYAFFRNSETYLPLLDDDKYAMSQLIQTYDELKRDLAYLTDELNDFPDADSDEQTVILGMAGETISNASMFILDLPMHLQSTDVGKNLSFG